MLTACFRPSSRNSVTSSPAEEIRAPEYSEPSHDPERLGEPTFTHFASLGKVTGYWLKDSLRRREALRSEDELIVPVISVRDDRIRVVVEDGSARIAIWIERENANETVIAKVRLNQTERNSPTHTGLWLKPGTLLRRLERNRTQTRVEMFENGIRSKGWVPTAFLGRVWAATRVPVAPRSTVFLQPHSTISDRPFPNSMMFTTSDQMPITLLQQNGDWSEIEIDTPKIYVRGFVSTQKIDALTQHEDVLVPVPSSRSVLPGMPQGVCLFAGITDEVVGVTLVGAENARRIGKWWSVFVSSPLARIEVLAQDPAKSATQPAWVMCPRLQR